MMQQLRPEYRDKSEPHQCSTPCCNFGTLQGSSILRSMRCLVSTTVLQSTTFLVETPNLASRLAGLPTYRRAFLQATKLMKLKEGRQRPRPFNGNLRGQTLGQTYRQFCRSYYHRTGTSLARLGQTNSCINIGYTTAMKSFRDAHLSSHLRSSAGRIGPHRRLCQLTSLRQLDFAYHHPLFYYYLHPSPTPNLKWPTLHLVLQTSLSRLSLSYSVGLSLSLLHTTLWFPSALPRRLTGTVTQARLPLANPLLSFALYVVSRRITVVSISPELHIRSPTNSKPTKSPQSAPHSSPRSVALKIVCSVMRSGTPPDKNGSTPWP